MSNSIISLAKERVARRPTRIDRRPHLAADAADDATAALMVAYNLLASVGRNREACEYRALAELAVELRAHLPGGLVPAA